MSGIREDIMHLRRSLALLASTIFVGAGMVLFASHLHDRASTVLGDLGRRADQVHSRLSTFGAEATQVKAGFAAHESLVARRIIGPEDRQQWLEQIDRIRQARRLFAVRYEFQPQTAASKDLAGDDIADGYQLMVSTMKLQLDLLHEYDLLGLLAELRLSVGAWLLTRECRIDRLPEIAGSAGRAQARLRAECVIDWLTLRETS
jgi:hypothetical protein